LKKWRPIKLLAWFEAFPITVIDIELVFEARIALGLVFSPISFQTAFLILGFSVIASITMSACFTASSKFVVPVIRFQIPFILLAVLMTFIVGLRRYILFTYTLVITSSRIFLVRQKIPRKIAKLFGVLPEWSLHEAPREHILSTSFRYIVPPGNLIKFLFNSGLFSIIIIVLQNQASFEAYLTNEMINIVLFFVYLILIFFIPLWISQLIGIIPRFSLLLYTRFNNLQIPYFKDLSTFSNVFGEQLEIFVEKDQIIRI